MIRNSAIDGLFRRPLAIFLPDAPRSSSALRKSRLSLRVLNFPGKLFTASNDIYADSVRVRASRSSGSEDHWFSDNLGLNEERDKLPNMETQKLELGPVLQTGTYSGFGLKTESISDADNDMVSSGPEIIRLNRELDDKKKNEGNGKRLGDDDVLQIQGGTVSGTGTGLGGGALTSGKAREGEDGKLGFHRRRQVMRRSNLFAKQVISIRSALSLGFVSELWVDTHSWAVIFVEVRPNLLSGDREVFLLEDVTQVGDVVLVQEENVIENEFKIVGLETLVGYKVVTPSQHNVGKVRGFTFNINSGDVETIELDSFGISILPSSLVSTYALNVEDVLEVVRDVVVVHEAAASRIQRLSKGLLGNQDVEISDELQEYLDFERQLTSDPDRTRVTRRNSGGGKLESRDFTSTDDWVLPKDYL